MITLILYLLFFTCCFAVQYFECIIELSCAVCKVHVHHAGFIVFRVAAAYIESFLFLFTMRIDTTASADYSIFYRRGENLYPPRDIPRYYFSLSSGSTSSFSHMRALFMSFDFHKLLFAT